MKKWIAAIAVVLGLVFSKPLHAQTIGSHPAVERGNRSIVLDVGGNAQIGFWTRSSDRTDLGLDLLFDGIFGESGSRVAVGITPSLKRYLSSEGALAPYTYLGIPLSYARIDNNNTGAPDTTDDTYSVGGLIGFGLEWLPIRQVSIGGHVGLRAYYYDQSGTEGTFGLRTQSSGVRVHLYF
jgi:hypothetical protein